MVGAHLLHELACMNGELEQEQGDTPGAVLDAEVDVALAVAKEGAGGAGGAMNVTFG